MKKILNLTLIILLVLTLSGCINNENKGLYFAIYGDETVRIKEDEGYHDSGFIAKDDGVDISSYVTVNNLVNSHVAGTYIITYTLDYQGVKTVLKRTVYVQYLNASCTLIEDTDTLECYKNWSSYLNTVITIKIYFNQDEAIDSEAVFNELETILATYHQISDKYHSYDNIVNIKTLNENPEATHEISAELFDLISYSLDNQKAVSSYFNIALGPVIEIWHDYRENCLINELCEVPDYQALLTAKAYTDPEEIIMDEENQTITMIEGMSLDLGGVSKGYISQILIDYLDTLPLDGYLLNNGESNISVGGINPTRESHNFVIGITNPEAISTIYEIVVLEGGNQIITSGDYQQYYLVDDVLYHHIISNTTLMPEQYCHSVSIIYRDPALGDIYSTAIFLMPIKDGIEFVNKIDGLEAIWYGIDGTIYYSENFESLYLTTD